MSTPMTEERLAEIRDQIAEDLDDSVGCLMRADQHRRELLAELDRLHSWAGLLSLLDEHWPACAWPALDSVEDAQDPHPSRTDSARIIGLIRWVEELLTLAARLNDQVEDLTQHLGQRQEDCVRVRAALLPLLVHQSLAGDPTTVRAGYVAEVAATAISDLTAEWERARQMVDWERERRHTAEDEAGATRVTLYALRLSALAVADRLEQPDPGALRTLAADLRAAADLPVPRDAAVQQITALTGAVAQLVQERDDYRQRWHLSATGWHRTCLKVVALADRLDANHADGQLLDADEQDLVEILAGLSQEIRDIVGQPRNLDSELENQVSPAAPHSRDLRQELTDWRQQLLDHPGTCATGDVAHSIAMLLVGGTVMPSTVEALRAERTRHQMLRQRVLNELPDVDATRHDLELVDLVDRVRSVVEGQPGPRTLRVHWGTDTLRDAEQQVRALAHALAGAYAGTVVRAAGGTDGSIRLGEAVITWSSLACLADTAAAVLRAPHGCECRPEEPTTESLIAAISAWLDNSYTPQGLSVEAHLVRRCVKAGEEFGEMLSALYGSLGENPRKGVTHTQSDIVRELLDVALAALGAVEHIGGNQGAAMAQLDAHIRAVAERARPHGLVDRVLREQAGPDSAPAAPACVVHALAWPESQRRPLGVETGDLP